MSSVLIRELRDTHLQAGKQIAACSYQDTVGVPAIFSKTLFSKLLHLRGDRGAGGLIKRHAHELSVVPFEQGSIDVDTREDYLKLPFE